MSRGLGRLQRIIKALIEDQHNAFDQGCERNDNCDLQFYLTWSDIRTIMTDDLGHRPSPALERAAKRALYTLYKRKEVGRIYDDVRDCYLYMPAQTYEEGFSPRAWAELKQAMEALDKKEGHP